jgi:hypothetical protein
MYRRGDLKLLISSILLMTIVAVYSRQLLGSQVQPRSTSKEQSLTANASCYDATSGRLVGSRTSRTSELVSPDGAFRAYAQSEAVASGTPNAPECNNTSRLLVADRDKGEFHAVLTLEPSRNSLGNGIDLVDWSPKGHRLLLVQGSWQYGSDVGETRVRVYDADSNRLSSESALDEAFSRYEGKVCAGIFQPLGFSSNGSAVVRAVPTFDYGEDKAAVDSCVQKQGFWLVDFAIGKVRQIADSYKPRQYGTVRP